MSNAGQSKTVPKGMLSVFEAVVALTDKVCDERLNDEYKTLCRQATTALCRKRPSPLKRGRTESWACGIAYAIGKINFLYDKSQTPHMTTEELCHAFGVSSSNASAKATLVIKAFDAIPMDPRWCLPSRLDDNPLAWIVEVDGLAMDARHLSLELQEAAYAKGLIPYIPSKQEQGPALGQLDDDREVVVEWMDPSEIPPLNAHAQSVLEAMQRAGEPLSRRQLLKATEIPASAWGNSLALLMMRGLVEFGRCKKRGEVYSYKRQEGERPANPPEPKEPRPLPPAESLPFFDMQDLLDWSDKNYKP